MNFIETCKACKKKLEDASTIEKSILESNNLFSYEEIQAIKKHLREKETFIEHLKYIIENEDKK